MSFRKIAVNFIRYNFIELGKYPDLALNEFKEAIKRNIYSYVN